ncbi:porin [Thiomicrorhabdus cannonii]|uniref:porin n=1 Tax=Thiomicrorhabdus cannonii TaxID=2748011 RepID=UPI0015BD2FF2|nr:porin [Thiomicrorhabdus cannonii]
MKKNIIALAIASAIAAPVAMADAPTVYGQINVSMDSAKDMGQFTSDRDSRVGVKGSEDLGNGLKAVYQMEFGVSVGNAYAMSGRNAVVGLGGSFGTVLLGRHDSPLKMSQAKDLFGDATYADMGKKQLMGQLGYGKKNGEIRFDNVVAYVSPEFAGIKIVAAGVGAENGTNDASLTNAYSIAAMYGSTKEGLYLAAAMDHADEQIAGATDEEWNHLRLSAQYATGGLVANVTYQDFKDGSSVKSSDEGTNIQVNVGYKMGAFMPKAKYSMTDSAVKANKDGSAYALGLDYSFGKKTTGYVEYMAADKKMGVLSGVNDDFNVVSVGMVHKF